jgi:hypothetical protein
VCYRNPSFAFSLHLSLLCYILPLLLLLPLLLEHHPSEGSTVEAKILSN